PTRDNQGLVTRTREIEDENLYRYIRIRPGLGDRYLSVSRLLVFRSLGDEWNKYKKVSHRSYFYSSGFKDLVQLLKKYTALTVLFIMLALALLSKKYTRAYKILRYSLAFLGIFSLALWWELFSFHRGRYLHSWDFGHYYIGAKYFPELGYDRLYECLA